MDVVKGENMLVLQHLLVRRVHHIGAFVLACRQLAEDGAEQTVAALALKHRCHYFDLTEDVEVTNHIRALSAGAADR